MAGDRPGRPVPASSMTRRQLLQHFGMVGGSSLMLGTMGAWDLMAAPAGPRPQLRGSGAETRVLVLGAGLSGLIVGYELGKLGYDVRILEARDRVGGMAWTVKRGASHTELGPNGERQVCNFDEGYYLNAGPWRIPHAHTGILGYCKELGVRLEQFVDDNLVMFNEDPALGALAGKKVFLRELKADLWGKTSELLAKAANHGALDDSLTGDDKERLVDFLVRAGYLDGPDQVYRADATMRGSGDSYDLSLLLRTPFAAQVRSLTAGIGGPDPVFQPTGGMMEIPLAFERRVGERITRGAEVRSIRQGEDGVRVVFRDLKSGKEQEVTADYVVSCLPISVLKTLDVNFSADMAGVVKGLNHAQQAKLGLQMKRRFWEEDDGIYGGHLVYARTAKAGGGGFGGGPANPLPQFSYPSSDYRSQKGVLLGFYGSSTIPGPDGKPLNESSVAARVEHVLTHGSRVHPQMRAEFDNAYAVWWEKVPYSQGAWVNNPGDRLERLSQPDGRIYIGSAAASEDPAWMEGAVHSAWRTVKSIHERAQKAG